MNPLISAASVIAAGFAFGLASIGHGVGIYIINYFRTPVYWEVYDESFAVPGNCHLHYQSLSRCHHQYIQPWQVRFSVVLATLSVN